MLRDQDHDQYDDEDAIDERPLRRTVSGELVRSPAYRVLAGAMRTCGAVFTPGRVVVRARSRAVLSEDQRRFLNLQLGFVK